MKSYYLFTIFLWTGITFAGFQLSGYVPWIRTL